MRNQLRFSGLLLFLMLMAVFMSGCGGGSDSGGGESSTPATFTPSAGSWSGPNISFTVRPDGSSIINFSLGPVNYTGTCSGTTTFGGLGSYVYPINNNIFSVTYTSSDATITAMGQFTGPDNANGTYSFSYPRCGGTVTGSGTWTASHS